MRAPQQLDQLRIWLARNARRDGTIDDEPLALPDPA
jgi:hypothetical protein